MAIVPDFASASRRHLDDAKMLNDCDRLPNADHLAGLAAECSIKEILIRGFGVNMSADGKPEGFGLHGHDLWTKVRRLHQGRSGPRFQSLLLSSPFNDWGIEQRYDDGASIQQSTVIVHLTAADKLSKMLSELEKTKRLP